MSKPVARPEHRRCPRVVVDLWGDWLAAVGFLTRIPVATAERAPDGLQEGYLARSMPLFPLVGAVVGGAAGATLLGADALGLPPLAAALAGLAVAAAVTGALHEDGLADLCDGLGGGRGREERLRIMRDSRIGTFGALALVFAVALKATLLAGMATPATAAAALVVAGALSRATLPAILHWLSPARDDGLAAAAGRPPLSRVVIGGVVAVIIALLVIDDRAVAAALLAAGAATATLALLVRAALGGHTGDVLGACQQTAEIATLAAVQVMA